MIQSNSIIENNTQWHKIHNKTIDKRRSILILKNTYRHGYKALKSQNTFKTTCKIKAQIIQISVINSCCNSYECLNILIF